MAEEKLVIAYWDIRGLAQPLRFLLEYTGIPYVDKRYVQGDAPDYSREDWLSVKNSLGLDFPNLPYLIDGDVKITQSNAILRYIARKGDPALLGKTPKEQAVVDMLIDTVMDFRNQIVRLCYSDASKFEAAKAEFLQKLPATLKKYEDYLGDKKFLVGDEPTVPDFHFCELLIQVAMMESSSLQDFPRIKVTYLRATGDDPAYLERFRALPAIAAYIKTDQSRNTPVNNKTAAWGGKETEASH